MVDLVNQIFCVALGKPPTMGQQFPQLFSPANAANLFLYADQGRPVAHAGLWMGTLHLPGVRLPVAALGSVCTLPPYRGQGLAGRLVAMAWERCREAGRPLLFISGDRSLYLRQGAHRAGRYRDLRLRPPAGTPKPSALPGLGIRLARLPEELPIVARLHQQEPVRWHRPWEAWPELIEAAGYATIYHLRQELWLVTVGENPVACWMTGRGEAFPGELLVLEAFGSRQALAASLQPLLAATGTEQARLPLLEGDPLGPALEAAGFPVGSGPVEPLPGTVAVTDWPLLWRELAPYLEERLPREWVGAQARVEAANGRSRYLLETETGEVWTVEGEAALIRALFGQGDQPVPEVPPHHPLAAALPLPLPWPKGLNYI